MVMLALCGLAACSSGSDTPRSSSTSSGSAGGSTVTTRSTAGTTSTADGSARGPHWTTYFGDNARTGIASDGPASPRAAKKLWASPKLDGDLYAQPLLIGQRVIVATENDTVYSLDASNGSVVWKDHLGEPVPGSSLPCGNVDPVGITSTPVIDETGTGRVYAVGMVRPGRHMLFELDLSDGHLVGSKPVDVDGADPRVHNQRGALSLVNSEVLVPYGGRLGDCGDYHGRLVAAAVSGAGIGAVTSYTLPTEGRGGWWAPPGAAVASDGSFYLASGNSSSSETFDYGNSVVRFSTDLRVLDSFAPKDWRTLDEQDGDLGSTSPVLLAGDRVFQVGKAGIAYLLKAKHLGGIGGELDSTRVCSTSAFGGVAHDGGTLFVPCSDGVVQVVVNGDGFRVGWTAALTSPGPTIIAGGAVWTVATQSGDLVALDPSSGKVVFSQPVGNVPSRFTSAAAGGGRVILGAGRTVFAFG